MGRSRRERVVALTKTRKHMEGREKKKGIVEDVRNAIDKYEHIYVFLIENQRNALLKNLRSKWSDSRFFFGRKSVMRIALGRSVEEEYLDGLHQMTDQLRGNVGLLLTNRSNDEVVKFFDEYAADDFARSGFEATERFHLPQGPLEYFEPNQINNLKLVGLPVGLKKGVVVLEQDLTVCETGETLTPEKAKILELMGKRMAKFRVRLQCHFQKDGSKFEQLIEDDDADSDDPIDEE